MSADNNIRRSIYHDLFKNIGKQRGVLQCQNYTAFASLAGKKYSHQLMVIGRAVNGWLKGWCPCEIEDDKNIEKYIEQLFENSQDSEQCPMSWVAEHWGTKKEDEYNTKKSAFWTAIRLVVRDLGISSDEDWASHLLWSNLYKISPFKGGNPNSKLVKIQRDYCFEILNNEIKEYKPRRILFLTGLNWATPFLEKFNFISENKSRASYVDDAGYLRVDENSKIKVVVAKHPQGKSREKIVAEINSGFKLLDNIKPEK